MSNPADITNYTTLKSAVETYLLEEDLGTADVPLFIALAEKELDKDIRVESVKTKLQSGALASPLAIPADYIDTIVFRLTSDDPPLTQISPQQLSERSDRLTSGVPQVYTILNGNFEFAPQPAGQTYEHFYLAKLVALSTGAPTNALLPGQPVLYFAAALVQAFRFFEDSDGEARWMNVYETAKSALMGTELRRRWSQHSVMTRG